jgi:SET domain-containing protein
MKPSDRIIHSMTWRLCRKDVGIAVYRVIRRVIPMIFPYTPQKSPLSELTLHPRFRVEVRKSTVEGAGDGLFALEDIPGGEVLGEYGGDRVRSLTKWLRLKNKDYTMMTDDPSVVIDAAGRHEALMRYVNHHFDARCHNLERKVSGETVYFVTTRPIVKGEEFFVDYGALYWKLRGVRV